MTGFHKAVSDCRYAKVIRIPWLDVNISLI